MSTDRVLERVSDDGREEEDGEREWLLDDETDGARRRGVGEALRGDPAWTMRTFSGNTVGGGDFLVRCRGFRRFEAFDGGGDGGGVAGREGVEAIAGFAQPAGDVTAAEMGESALEMARKERKGDAPVLAFLLPLTASFSSFVALFSVRRAALPSTAFVSFASTFFPLVCTFTAFSSPFFTTTVPTFLALFGLGGCAIHRISSRWCRNSNLASSALPALKADRVIPLSSTEGDGGGGESWSWRGGGVEGGVDGSDGREDPFGGEKGRAAALRPGGRGEEERSGDEGGRRWTQGAVRELETLISYVYGRQEGDRGADLFFPS